MNKRYRKIIYFIFVAGFLITIPLILARTAGYKYNFKKGKFEKTGSILINVRIKGTELYIDNKYFSSKNIWRIKGVFPGEYSIKLAKDGYFDWQKKLPVLSELTTFVKNIRLFKKNEAINLAEIDASSIYTDGNDGAFLLSGKNNTQISFFNKKTSALKNLFNGTYKIKNISISPNGEKITIQSAGIIRIISLANSDIKILSPQTIRAKWPEKENNFIITQEKNIIYKVSLNNLTKEELYIGHSTLSDFLISQNFLYILEENEIKQIPLKSGETASIPLERKNYHISSEYNNVLVLISDSDKIQILPLPLSKNSNPALIANGKDYHILGNKVLFYNDFELWVYDSELGRAELITRISEEIKKAIWLNSGEGIAYMTKNNLKVIELDSRNGRQSFDLLYSDNLNDFIIGENFTIYIVDGKNLKLLEI